jgi:hypothetical protein
VKRLLLSLTICLAGFAAACGGGGTPTPPPPVVVGFATSSLKGQYAFEMSGADLNGGFLARVGTFTADGAGNISAAVEDVNDAGSFSFVQFTGGTYTIGTDGRGTITLNGGALGGGLGLSIVLNSVSSGEAIQIDENATSSGSFDLQTASAFSLPSITGTYAFDLSGQDVNGAPLSVVGSYVVSSGVVTTGTSDINDGSSTGPSGPVTIPATSFQMDPNFGASSGRGSVSLNGQTLAFYIVDGTRLKMLEEDTTVGVTVGDSFVQSGTIPTTTAGLAGNFAFIVGDSAVTGNFGAIGRAGSASFNAGALSSVSLDDNNDGKYSKLTGDAGTYTIDGSGNGRGTFTFTDASFGTFTYVFYLSSPTAAVLQETSSGLIGSGSMSSQPAAPSNSSVAGNYAFNWSGTTLPSSGNVGFEEDFAGQYALSSAGAITGAVDFAELGSTSTPIFTDVPVSGTFTVSGLGRNTYKATVSPGGGAPSTTFNYAAYVTTGNTLFLVVTDSTRVTVGTAVMQTTPTQ